MRSRLHTLERSSRFALIALFLGRYNYSSRATVALGGLASRALHNHAAGPLETPLFLREFGARRPILLLRGLVGSSAD